MIELVGVDTDGSSVWHDERDGSTYNSADPLTDDERQELLDAGWDGVSQPWEKA